MFLYILLFAKIYVCNAPSYYDYHYSINKADSVYFIAKKYNEALSLYKQTLEQYAFVWIEDCLKFTQLAIVNKNEKLALFFLKRAIDNGLELKMLKYLNLGCSCDFYNSKKEIDILTNFVAKYQKELNVYYLSVRKKYLSSIDTVMVKTIIEVHLKDEIAKNYRKNFTYEAKDHNSKYYFKVRNIYYFLDSLYKQKKYLGDKNLGTFSVDLMNDLKLNSINFTLAKFCEISGIKNYKDVPHHSEKDFFQSTPLYITYIHLVKSGFKFLDNYHEVLIKNGYLHPREYAYLKSCANESIENELKICPIYYKFSSKCDNKLRYKYLLPGFEIDKAKHNYQHQYDIKLLFGFFGCSK